MGWEKSDNLHNLEYLHTNSTTTKLNSLESKFGYYINMSKQIRHLTTQDMAEERIVWGETLWENRKKICLSPVISLIDIVDP